MSGARRAASKRRSNGVSPRKSPFSVPTPAAFSLVLTCEHASAHVPARFREIFASEAAERALHSHRGWDPGALRVARHLARSLDAPLYAGKMSRLLIDLNRPLRHPDVLSQWSRRLAGEQREMLVREHLRHWDAVTGRLQEGISAEGPAVHLGVHSFTPNLSELSDPAVKVGHQLSPRSAPGQRGLSKRNFDVGVLYDPQRRLEVHFASRLVAALQGVGLCVRRNAPYRGVAAGLTTSLRRTFAEECYAGLELELNQARFACRASGEAEVISALVSVLACTATH